MSPATGDFHFSNEISDPSHKGFFHLKQPYRSFQILKSNRLALAWPTIYILIHPTGGTASSSSPSYHSCRLSAVRQKAYLPPTIKLFAGGSPPLKDVEEEGPRIAKAKYTNWEGLIGMKSEITITKPSEIGTEDNSAKVLVRRIGGGRRYEVKFQGSAQASKYSDGLEWKGSKSALRALLQEQREESVQNGQVPKHESSLQNGNLKLISPSHPEKGVLAVWHNRTDKNIMGNLYLFEKFDEGIGENGLLEEVIASCLTVVAAERMSARGWLGGLGKRGKVGIEHE
jgi:hypothetical protein